MNEVKFRAWDKKGKGFVNGFNMLGFCTGQGAPRRKLRRYDTEWDIDDVILEQLTNMNDCEGRAIYENDIFKSLSQVGVIKKKEGCWIIDWAKRPNALTEKLYPHIEEGKVIGNIHLNPELLT